MSQLLSDLRAGGGLITAVNGGNNITVVTVAGVATVNVSGTTNHAVQVGNALGALTSLALGNAGQVLTSNGPGLDPSFQNFPGSLVKTITGNDGIPEAPLLGNFNFLTANATVKFAGSAATETLNFNLSNLALGSNMASLTTGVRNVGLGSAVLFAMTSGNDNTAIGFGALTALVGANNSNTAVGSLALTAATAGSNNTAIGDDALTLLATGSNNTALGRNAGSAYNAAEANTITIGSGVIGIAGESNVIRIGQSNTSGIQLTGANNRLLHNFGTQNIFLGDTAGNFTLTTANAIGDTAVGFQALQALTLGAANTALGQSAGTAITTGNRNTAIGLDALELLTTGSDNIALGQGAGAAYTTESGNITIGLAGVVADASVTRIANIYGTTVGATNAVVVIDNTGKLGTAGGGADFIATITGNDGTPEAPSAGGNFNFLTANSTVKFAGSAATETLDFGATSNLCLGTSLPSLAGGIDNTSLGAGFAGGHITSGSLNVSIGYATAGALTSGGSNVSIGSSAGTSYTTESNNICIGTGVNGTIGDSAITRIGAIGIQTKCFIAGIDGVNVGSVAKVVTMASDQLGTATITAGTGVSIVPTANVITVNAVGGGLTWTVETVNLTAAVNHGYIANKAGTLAIALPAVSAIGDVIRITGMNTALGWQITQAAGQQIFVGTGNTTLGATGTITSTAIRDSIEIVCIAANTTWNAISWVGNLTLV